MMPRTYEPIASTTLGSDTADVTFSSIPGTYTDLVLVVWGSGTTAADGILEFNGDTASNYSTTVLRATGSTVSSVRYSAAYLNSAGTWAGEYIFIVQIQSYANTNVFKTWLTQASSVNRQDINRQVGLWRSTNAITSIKVKRGTGNIVSGATLSLYGIKAA
jgi:regulatory protein YycH of two-component signal transduction system YycFG